MFREQVQLVRGYLYHSRDLLVAFNDAIDAQFGPDAITSSRVQWYKPKVAPTCFTFQTGPKQERSVSGGFLSIRGFPGYFAVDGEHSVIQAHIPKSHKLQAEALLRDVQLRLEANSIYRGKAVTTKYEFMDLPDIGPESLVYNEKVERDLRAHVWALIERPQDCQQAGVQIHRKILFAGPFGAGKTMAVLLTATKAIRNGWTSIYVEQTVEPSIIIEQVLEHSHKYQPAVVIIEDYDREQRGMNAHAFGHLMNAIDGAKSKTGDLIVIMTTNYPEKISAGLQRPGRIDKIIDFKKFESHDIIRLLKKLIPPGMLDETIDWAEIGFACKDYTPAFVHEVGNSAKLMAISSCPERPRVTKELLLEAAGDLHYQHRVCSKETVGLRSE